MKSVALFFLSLVHLQAISLTAEVSAITSDDGCDDICREMPNNYGSIQLINEDGVFDATGLDRFVKILKMTEHGKSYAVVSIMGPQSSGKSTLLNHLFGTKFKEMNAYDGRYQTTRGIWFANCVYIERFTLVMDIEGTDGRERGQDDTTFEKQSTLFALAVSDIVLINMWCHDIGREQAANKPLLRIVFQAMMKLKSLRKKTLLFVIRDKTQTPAKKLESILKMDIQKIWDNVSKPDARKLTRFSDLFHVEAVFLPHYEFLFGLFLEEVDNLRQRLRHHIAHDVLAENREEVVPASGFARSVEEIWKIVKENKDLDLPAHKVMVATVRCEEIGKEKLSSMITNEDWIQLERASQHKFVPKFGYKLNALLDECLSRYDMDTTYFDEDIRASKRKQLLSNLKEIVKPVYHSMLGHIQSKALDDFKEAFNEALRNEKEGIADASQCAHKCTKFLILSEFDHRVSRDAASIDYVDCDPFEARDNLARDIDAHAATKLNELVRHHEEKGPKGVLAELASTMKVVREVTSAAQDLASVSRMWLG